MYSMLINMGFEDDISLKAAQQSKHINQAIEWITNNKAINCNDDNFDEIKTQNRYIHSDKDADICCNGQSITNCVGLQRIILMLKFYNHNHNKYDKFNNYLQKYEKHLINDYHHILDKHLNEDRVTKIDSNKQFELIHQQIIEQNLLCNITKCDIYSRNNRERETTNIDCDDRQLSMFIDIIDSIHCYFLHSVDIGYRIIGTLNDNHLQSKCNAYDSEMRKLRSYLSSKRHKIETTRGKNRMINSKFMTNFSNGQLQAANEEKKQQNNPLTNVPRTNQIQMEGYLQKRSLHLKQFRKRFIVLQNRWLYSYNHHNKTKLTEKIDLTTYSGVRLSESNLCQFKVDACDDGVKSRVFNAASSDEAEEWSKAIYKSINFFVQNNCLCSECQNNIINCLCSEMETRLGDALNVKNKDPLFSFGNEYEYWKYRQDSWFTSSPKGKYKSIKHEVTSNQIYTISIKQFNDAYNRAEYLLRSSPIIKNLQVSYWHPYMIHNLQEKTPPNTNHILSVILYTDYDSLSYKFSETFRGHKTYTYGNDAKRKNKEYWNWSKTLIETVNYFGTTLGNSKVSVFYHGVSFMYFHYFRTPFHLPTSTTTKLQIATIFAANNGIIIELGHNNDKRCKPVKYFNCAFVSAFANEEERLFIQPYNTTCSFRKFINILSIRNMSTDENYRKYIQPLNIFQSIFDYRVEQWGEDDAEITRKYVDVLNDLLVALIGNNYNNVPDYIKQILKKWSNNVCTVHWDLDVIQKLLPGIHLFDNNNLLQMDKLYAMFDPLYRLEFASSLYNKMSHWVSVASMLDKINQLLSSKCRSTILFCVINMYVFDLKPHLKKIRVLIETKYWNFNFYEPDGHGVFGDIDEAFAAKHLCIQMSRCFK